MQNSPQITALGMIVDPMPPKNSTMAANTKNTIPIVMVKLLCKKTLVPRFPKKANAESGKSSPTSLFLYAGGDRLAVDRRFRRVRTI
jgi:hypothetical protein